MFQYTNGTVLDPQRVNEILIEDAARFKKALEDIVKIADPPGPGPQHEDCERILTCAVLALEHWAHPDGTLRR